MSEPTQAAKAMEMKCGMANHSERKLELIAFLKERFRASFWIFGYCEVHKSLTMICFYSKRAHTAKLIGLNDSFFLETAEDFNHLVNGVEEFAEKAPEIPGDQLPPVVIEMLFVERDILEKRLDQRRPWSDSDLSTEETGRQMVAKLQAVYQIERECLVNGTVEQNVEPDGSITTKMIPKKEKAPWIFPWPEPEDWNG